MLKQTNTGDCKEKEYHQQNEKGLGAIAPAKIGGAAKGNIFGGNGRVSTLDTGRGGNLSGRGKKESAGSKVLR